jgi:hypothetical protein
MAYTGTLTPPDGITLWDNFTILSNGTILVTGYSDFNYETNGYQYYLLNYTETGELNTAFGERGVIQSPEGFNLSYNQTIGDKIQLVGSKWNESSSEHEYYVARYDFSGKSDSSFGVNGVLTPPEGVVLTQYPNVYWDGGSIYAVGAKSGAGVLMRFDKAGKFDGSFGAGGFVTAPSDVQFNNGFSKLNDGSYLISGNLRDDPTTTDINESTTSVLVSYLKNGTLNTGFGVEGKITAPAVYYLWSNQQADGKIQVQGNKWVDNSYSKYYVAQYTSTGQIDTGFGINGVLTPPVGIVMTSQPQTNWQDGTLFVPGKTEDGSNVLLRFSAKGLIDTSFGESGLGYIVSPEGVILGNSVGTLRDGSYLVSASSASNNVGGHIGNNILVHYTKNWALDSDFGDDGKITGEPGFHLWANEVGAGKLWVIGNKWVDGKSQYSAVQYTSNGKLDVTFGTNGVLTPPDGFVMTGYPNNYWQDGSLYVSAEKTDGTAVLLHFTSSGKLDESFGGSGKGFILAPSGITLNQGITTLADESYLLSGQINDGSNTGVLLRYTKDWIVDTSFGTGGKVVAPIGYSVWANEVSSGKLQLQGSKFEDGKSTFVFAQLTSKGQLDTSFGMGGFITPPSGISNTGYICQMSDGRFTATGEKANGTSVLMRFGTNGKLDKIFGFGKAGAQSGYIVAPSGITLNACPTTLLDGSYLISGQSTDGKSTGVLYHYSQTGILDASFGSGGKIQGREGFYLWASEVSGGALQVNGNRWNGGTSEQYLEQYTSKGLLDVSFGENETGRLAAPEGFVFQQIVQSPSTRDFLGLASRVSGDGKILSHYSKAGVLDTNFGGGDGIIDIDGTRFGWIADFKVLNDGDLLLAAYSANGPGLSLCRFNSDGSMDPSFGIEGVLDVATIAVPANITLSTYQQPLLCADGGFLISGNTTDGSDTAVLIRYSSDGSLNGSFGTTGYIKAPDGISSLDAVQMADGGFGVIGSANGSFGTIDYVAKYDANGRKDNSVGVNGVLVAPKGTKFTNIILQEDGSILASVVSTDEEAPGITQVLRYNSDGRLDQSSVGVVYTVDGQDIIAQANKGNSKIFGGTGNDTLLGAGGSDTLNGGSGNDELSGGAGNDRINGGAGIDCADYEIATSAVNVNLQTGRATGQGNDILTGIEDACTGIGRDVLTGSSGANVLSAGAGSDTLYGAAANDQVGDTLEGGTGTNTYVVNTTFDTIIDHGTNSVIRSAVGFDLSSSKVSGVNNLIYTGKAGAVLSGNRAANSITGGAGNDSFYGSGGNDSFADTLLGGGGNDLYIVNSTRDRIIDSGGVNTIRSEVFTNLASSLVKGVNNLIYMGGSSLLQGNSAANRIDASAASGAVSLNGGAGADTLIGSNYNDTIMGNGKSSLVGGAGANTFVMSGATNRINNAGGDVASLIRSSVGYDLSSSLNGGAGNVNGVNNLFYTGTAGAVIKGNANANSITGGAGKDTMQGWSGNAAFNATSDTLAGGSGSDLFILSALKQSDNAYGNGRGGTAYITDFEGGASGDKIQLRNFGSINAGSSGYQTLSGGASIVDIYSYLGTDDAHNVAHLTMTPRSSFDWSKNASFV